MFARVSRRTVFLAAIVATAISFFTLGVTGARYSDAASHASYEATIEAIRSEVKSELGKGRGDGRTAGTAGGPAAEAASMLARAEIVASIKRELQNEMGLVPLQLLRDRRSSFVELHSYDNFGKASYGTAGYLGDGYFITVKHAVVALPRGADGGDRKIKSVKIVYLGREVSAKVVDTGDANAEVHSGDWAIIKTRPLDLPALQADTDYAYEFAAPIFRLGNDYSKGIMLSTGYVGQRTAAGLVTCLTDGHPGVSGGGVLSQQGTLVGIPVGRMQDDYRFSFILPLRAEMLRKVPHLEAAPEAAPVDGILAGNTSPNS